MVLPGIIPRLKEFAGSGFGALAQLMALIFYSVRLLPPHHPYLRASNQGRFGIRHVIAEAARHIEFKRENTDQIIIFFAVLTGAALLIVQCALLLLTVFIHPVFAAGPTPLGFFQTADATNDIAYMLLDLVFGVPGVFTGAGGTVTCVAFNTNCLGGGFAGVWPSPFHVGLQTMFRFYNLAILLVGALIFLYYVLIVVGETATTGTPFGKRFNHVWAPLRLVTAVGLLIPLGYGLNTAQYIVLYAAKFGSSFASNGWSLYNNAIEGTMGGPNSSVTNVTGTNRTSSISSVVVNPMIAPPAFVSATNQVDGVLQFMSLARACKTAYEAIYQAENIRIEPWLVSRPFNATVAASAIGPAVPGSPVWGATATGVNPISPGSALEFYNGGDIIVRFGHNGAAAGQNGQNLYDKELGGVFPFCGEITISTGDLKYQGAKEMQRDYYNWILSLWENPALIDFGIRAACIHAANKAAIDATAERPCDSVSFVNVAGLATSNPDDPNQLPNDAWKNAMVQPELGAMIVMASQAYNSMQNEITSLTTDIRGRGWGGAGIWYNQIAQMNGGFQSAVRGVPLPSRMPSVMLDVMEARRAQDMGTSGEDRYNPNTANSAMSVRFVNAGNMNIARMLNDVYQYWRGSYSTGTTEMKTDSNPIFTVMNAIFGTDGLMNIRKMDNIHPLAQLSSLGKGIMDTTIRNLMAALGFAAAGGATEALSAQLGGALGTASSAIISVATVGLTIGFILYYVLPFLPFIYFFFAVGGWVKTIFEAMVGAPLWALAHLRIDGEGLPGQAALNGYFLIFEIFLRPILTVFGLLAAVIAFSALAQTLNGLFPLLLSNASGYDTTNSIGIIADLQFKRSILDEFFYTVVYTILVYLIGVSSFKLIDQIPANILRWMGAGVQVFRDQDEDLASGLTQYATVGAHQIAPQVIDAAKQGAHTFGYAAGRGVMGLTSRNASGKVVADVIKGSET